VIPTGINTLVSGSISVFLERALDRWKLRAAREPAIDMNVMWSPRGLPVAHITLKNRAELAISLHAVEVVEPMGAKVGWDPRQLAGMTPPFPDPPGGALFSFQPEVIIQPGDAKDLYLYFKPPDGWTSGTIRLRALISRSTSTAGRRKWYRVDRQLIGEPWIEPPEIDRAFMGTGKSVPR
jgi:hypothetical protein